MNGLIVRSETFSQFKVIGNPYSELERYSEWLADELVYVDITREGEHDMRRSDHKVKDISDPVELLRAISRSAFMPLTYGGRIMSADQATGHIANGADKVLVNTLAYRQPAEVTEIARRHGAQSVMVGIDIRRESDGRMAMYVDQGRTRVDDDPVAYAKRSVDLGAGEILLTSIDRDGTASGYDLPAITAVAEAVSVPVIACGGVGMPEHFTPAVKAGAAAVAAGNMFHFTENAYKRAKRALQRSGVNVRYPYTS
jgi:cyclase